jgi:hypothetical protein
MFINLRIPQASKGFLCGFFLPLNHKPSRAFGCKDHDDGLNCRSNEEERERNLVSEFAIYGMSTIVNTGTYYGPN